MTGQVRTLMRQPPDSLCRGELIIPLENCKVVETPEGPLTFALRSSNPFGDQVKSAKRMKNGSLIQGKHKEYVFKAESFEKEAMWVKALKNEVTDNPLLDTLAERRAKARGERRRTKQLQKQ